MPQALNPADRSSLVAETGPVNMAMAGVIIAEGGPGVSAAALSQRIAERIHLLPRYRQRLREPRIGVIQPVWIDDEHFDLDWHVRSSRLPEPGGDAELGAWVAAEASRKMDRSRPLWELHVIEGLAGDRVAIVPKMHHALADGMGAVGAAMLLVDPTPEPIPIDPPEEEWRPRSYDARRHLVKIASGSVSRAQGIAIRATGRLLEADAASLAGDAARGADLIRALSRRHPAPPALPLNRPISPNRSYGLARASLDVIKRAAKAQGGTVNDGILAAVAGMLRGYLKEAGIDAEGVGKDPVALVPVSVRGEGDGQLGNRISVVLVDLPAAEPDPAARIRIVTERMEAIKGSAEIAAGALRVDMIGFAPPLFASAMALAPGGGGAFNLVVSNVPGPQEPIYVNGSRVLAVHPVVPLNPADQGLNVGVFSYDGGVFFGLSADRDLDPPIGRAVAALEAAIEELIALAT